MKCKECGFENVNPIFKAVHNPDLLNPMAIREKAVNPLAYIRWACSKCGRYHFKDGTLYSNPFKEQKQ